MSYDPRNYSFDPVPANSAPRKSNTGLILLAILGGIGILCTLACCGTGAWVVNFGMSVVGAEIEEQLRDNPQIQEHVGTIQSLEVNWTKSLAESDEDIWTWDVQGTKGSGVLIVESVSEDEGEVIISADLRMSTGEEFELAID